MVDRSVIAWYGYSRLTEPFMPDPDVEPKDKRTNEWKAWKARQQQEPASMVVDSVAAEAPPPVVVDMRSPLDSPEWKFIQGCIENTEIEFGSGTTTGAVKRLYNDLRARLRIWRLAQEIVAEVGIGGPWPQFSALNRNPDTGEKVEPKLVVAVLPTPPPQVVIAPAGPMDDMEKMKQMARAMAGGEIASRAPREPVAATA